MHAPLACSFGKFCHDPDNWLSNRVFKSYDDILDHCCFAWNKLIEMPWENYVYRNSRMGLSVLIRETWYNAQQAKSSCTTK